MAVDTSWSLQPGVLAGLALAAVVYGRRWRAVRGSANRLAAFCGGLLLIAAALISPLDTLSGQLFFLHMTQHVLLLDLAPILLIVGLTKVILRPATRRLAAVERALDPLGHPVFAVVLYVGVAWSWHVPGAYDAALRHPALHVLEHVSYMSAGGLYWWHLLAPIRSRLRLGGMGPVLYMASTKLLVGLLGIVLAFSPGTLFDFYSHQGGHLGLSPHDDQALAGATMALEQSLVMGVALASLFVRMLGETEREAQRADRYEGA